jgi:sterol desaturase/sphingolipid hydroxylase (fatty acid hydroxylase superfamily)
MADSSSRILTYTRGDQFIYNPSYLPKIALVIYLSVFYLISSKYLSIVLPYITSYKKLSVFYVGIIGMVTTILINLFYYACYVLKNKEIEKYKVTNEPWPWDENPKKWKKDLKSLLITYFTNYFVFSSTMISFCIKISKPRYDLESSPSFLEFVFQIFFSVCTEDFFNYWSHRIFHLPIFYKRIHKKHHEYYNSIAMACIYAHPIEFIVANMFPALTSLLMLRSNMHVITLVCWLCLRVFYTHDGHSGYDFPFSPFKAFSLNTSSVYHNYHHLKNNGNYGSITRIWDHIFGTNIVYLDEQKERFGQKKNK